MRILITGITGFAGRHLAELLLPRDHHLIGVGRQPEWLVEQNQAKRQIEYRQCNWSERESIERILAETKPEQIYHLAGSASVGRSLREPKLAWEGNLQPTLQLYGAITRWGKQPRILYVGTGLVYGSPECADHAFTENDPLRPENPYAASKAAADLASYQYVRSHGLQIVRVRPFNHIGPRQSPEFAVPHFARQLAQIARRERPPELETGNLTSQRDLTDVRDVVVAYELLMNNGRVGEVYNVGSGESHSMQSILDHLLRIAGVTVTTKRKAEETRTVDSPVVRADCTKIEREIGWRRSYNLEQTLRDVFAYWRCQG